MVSSWRQWLPASVLVLALAGCDLEALTGLAGRPPLPLINQPRPGGNATLNSDQAAVATTALPLINALPAAVRLGESLELPARTALTFSDGADAAASLQILVMPPLEGAGIAPAINVGDDRATPLSFRPTELGCSLPDRVDCLTAQPLTLLPARSQADAWYLLTYIFIDVAGNNTVAQRFLRVGDAPLPQSEAVVVSDAAGLAEPALAYVESLPSVISLNGGLLLPATELPLAGGMDRDRALRIRVDPPLSLDGTPVNGYTLSATDLNCSQVGCTPAALSLIPERTVVAPLDYLFTFTFKNSRGDTTVIQRFVTVVLR